MTNFFFPQYNQPWYSYMRDQVGTIYKVYGQNTRSIAESRAYDSFGNLVNQTGTAKTNLGFQGKYYDSESGLNYFYHRYYNPAIGRFTSEDPIGSIDDSNQYRFESNNTVNMTDTFGLASTGGPWHPPQGIHTKCNHSDSCSQLGQKIWVLNKMIKSHSGWDLAMPYPRGGNRHYQEIRDLWIQLVNCERIYKSKCNCDGTPKAIIESSVVGALLVIILWKGAKIVLGGFLGGPGGAFAGAVL